MAYSGRHETTKCRIENKDRRGLLPAVLGRRLAHRACRQDLQNWIKRKASLFGFSVCGDGEARCAEDSGRRSCFKSHPRSIWTWKISATDCVLQWEVWTKPGSAHRVRAHRVAWEISPNVEKSTETNLRASSDATDLQRTRNCSNSKTQGLRDLPY